MNQHKLRVYSVFLFLFIFLTLKQTALIASPPGQPELPIYTQVDFEHVLRTWDGFGINYVESCQTRDYFNHPQDYGGFSLLSEKQQDEILHLIFSEDGLRPGIIKMFLDPWHEGTMATENDNNDPRKINKEGYDHKTTTRWMRHFVREGLKINSDAGRKTKLITTLYGPPPWMTKQKYLLGRDLDPALKEEVGEYIIAWVKYLIDEEGFPVDYVSIHNEGEGAGRWTEDGYPVAISNDYNMYWPPDQITDFMTWMRGQMDHFGLQHVGLCPGEATSWVSSFWDGHLPAVTLDKVARSNMALATSHSFWGPTSINIDMIRTQEARYRTGRDTLHAWTTSISWKKMNTDFLTYYYHEIYDAKVNAIIPWAAVQVRNGWIGSIDPNPGCAISVDSSGTYTVNEGYYYYKQVSRAGMPGMKVVKTFSSEKDIYLIGFSQGRSQYADSFVIINNSDTPREIPVYIRNSSCNRFEVFRTSPDENFIALGSVKSKNNWITVELPAKSVVSCFGKK